MYAEDYENRGFPFRNFLLKLILVIVFALILVWFLPKFIQPKIVQQNCAGEKKASTAECSSDAFKALTSQIFQDNLDKMKEAAVSYYTNDRLPVEPGDKDKMTLKDMIEKKIILELYDKNNKKVDEEASYVEITKMDNEYLLKVNIKDSEKEDYILVHLGCYNYCKSLLCEKEDYVNGQIKASKASSTVAITPGYSSYTVNTSNVPSTTVVNRYYTGQPIYNYYYYTTTNNTTNTTTTTTIINNYCSDCDEPTPSQQKYIYEYKKVTGAKIGDWTPWGAWEKADCNTAEIKCSDNNPSCLKELQMLKRKEQIGTYNKTFAKERQESRQVGTRKELSCSKYNYLIIDNKSYTLTTTTEYTRITTLTTTRQAAIRVAGGWEYVARRTYKVAPKDTLTTHYKFVGADYSKCTTTCLSEPEFIYDVYTYKKDIKEKALTETTLDVHHNTVATASCGELVQKEIPIFRTITVTDKSTINKPLYGTVCYKSTKTREVIDHGKTKYKWSYKNNKSLINDGWVMTGKKKAI